MTTPLLNFLALAVNTLVYTILLGSSGSALLSTALVLLLTVFLVFCAPDLQNWILPLSFVFNDARLDNVSQK